jgi:hypothetical protein
VLRGRLAHHDVKQLVVPEVHCYLYTPDTRFYAESFPQVLVKTTGDSAST